MKLAIFLMLICPLSANAQDYYWKTIPEKEHHKSAVQIDTKSHMGTGVIVRVIGDPDEKGYKDGVILTCLHVAIWDNNTGNLVITFRCGKKSKGKIIKWDAVNDLCTISAKIPVEYVPAEFADTPCVPGDVLEAVGLGGAVPINSVWVRRFEFVSGRLTDSEKILADEVVVPGDSGGPVFRDGKLVGIMSAGCRNEEVSDPLRLYVIRGYWGAVIIPTELGKDLCLKD